MLWVLAAAGAGALRMLGVSRAGCAMRGGRVGRAAHGGCARCAFHGCGGYAPPHTLRVRRVYAAAPFADACGNLMDDRLDEEQMGEVLC